jgi:hypothetical protein
MGGDLPPVNDFQVVLGSSRAGRTIGIRSRSDENAFDGGAHVLV